jgi:hypothetical protein
VIQYQIDQDRFQILHRLHRTKKCQSTAPQITIKIAMVNILISGQPAKPKILNQWRNIDFKNHAVPQFCAHEVSRVIGHPQIGKLI